MVPKKFVPVRTATAPTADSPPVPTMAPPTSEPVTAEPVAEAPAVAVVPATPAPAKRAPAAERPAGAARSTHRRSAPAGLAALATPAPVTLDRTGRRAVELAARTYHAALVKLRERAAELAATLATHGTRAEPAELARVLADAGLTLDDLPADVVDQLGAGQHR